MLNCREIVFVTGRMKRDRVRIVDWFLGAVLLTVACSCADSKQAGSSMAPTIAVGEKITVNYLAYAVSAPSRWDVVAFEPPMASNQIWVLRIVALPGESVSFTSSGFAVNEKPLTAPQRLTNVSYGALPSLNQVRSTITFPYVVPTNSYFVLGDNSATANDSRIWGAIPRGSIVGKVNGK